MRHIPTQSPWLHAIAVTAIVAICYLCTMVPGAYYTDSGELTAAAATLGIAHPTGYPLFSLVGHVWCMLPFASPIVAMNVFAAVCTAAAMGGMVLVMHSLLRLLQAGRADKGAQSLTNVQQLLLADATALLLGFCTLVWNQGTSVEVYSLHLLLFVLALHATLRSVERPASLGATLLAGFCTGLMFGNHLSALFLVPGLMLVWFSVRRTRTNVVYATAMAMLPALLYVFLWMRSAQHPVINWGLAYRGWDEFLYHVKGTQFGVWLFSDSGAASRNFSLLGSLLTDMLLYLGWIPVVYGLVRGFRQNRWLVGGLTVIAVGNVGISLGYAIPDIDSYFLPTFVVTAILFAMGIYGWVQRIAQPSAVLGTIAVVAPIVALAVHMPSANRSHHTAVDDYTEWVLANAEPNAIIISHQWDYFISNFWYRQFVLGERPDVAVIDKELLRRTWYTPWLAERYPSMMAKAAHDAEVYQEYLVRFEHDPDEFTSDPALVNGIQTRFVALLNGILDSNATRPVYITPEVLGEERGFADGYQLYPSGPLIRLSRTPLPYRKTRLDGTDRLAEVIRRYHDRLDHQLRDMTLRFLETSAQEAERASDRTAADACRQRAALLLHRH